VHRVLEDVVVTDQAGAVRCDLTVIAPVRAEFLRVAVREVGTGRTGALEVPLPLDGVKP
jgi:hypothetical protein